MSNPDSGDDASPGSALARLFGWGAPPDGGDPLDYVRAVIAQRSQAPAEGGGLFGGDYARQMADRLAPLWTSQAPGTELSGPPLTAMAATDAAAPASDVGPIGAAPSVLGRSDVAPPATGSQGTQDAAEEGDAPSDSDEGGASSGFELAAANSTTPGSGPAGSAAELDAVKQLIRKAEGRRTKVYLDSVNVPTVGYGHKVVPADHLKLGDEISPERAEEFFRADVATALASAHAQARKAGIIDQAFIPPLTSVNYQMPAWKQKFPKAWQDIVDGNYDAAAEEVARGGSGGPSRWAQQTPDRVETFQAALRALAHKSKP